MQTYVPRGPQMRCSYVKVKEELNNGPFKLKLRIGTVWRRIASANVIMVLRDITTYLAPSQLVIGLNAGLVDIITTTMQVHADQYLSKPARPANKPSCTILLLDIPL